MQFLRNLFLQQALLPSSGIVVAALFFSTLSFQALAFEPFFDDDPSTVFAPVARELDAFDRVVIELCGDWGAVVKKKEFSSALQRDANKSYLIEIQKHLQNSLKSNQSSPQFLNELANIWFERKGFEHIFCGEPSKRDLGGLHYFGRYAQAQQKAWAGFARKRSGELADRICRQSKEDVDGGVYTIGVYYRPPKSDDVRVKCISGYHIEMNALDILIEATKAYKLARQGHQTGKYACIYKISATKSYPAHGSLLVIDRDAIRTFYPLTQASYEAQSKRLEICGNV